MRFDYYNYSFYNISENHDETCVETVSHLRHYLNCFGLDKKLKDFLNKNNVDCNTDFIEEVAETCFGNVSISDLSKDKAEETIKQCLDAILRKEEAIEKNKELIEIFQEAKESFCGLGLRKTKLRLNKLGKNDNVLALLYRKLLELADVNVRAKDAYLWVQNAIYKKKEELLKDLVEFCEKNNFNYGSQESENYSTSYVIYFDAPHCGQISFHTSDNDFAKSIKKI